MRAKHIALVVHGDRADRPDLRHLVSWVRDKGHFVEPFVTFETGDAAASARRAAHRGVDVVAAVGGDGTVNEVVNGLDGFDVPLPFPGSTMPDRQRLDAMAARIIAANCDPMARLDPVAPAA